VLKSNITLGAIIGEGQFGDVHRGTLKSKVVKQMETYSKIQMPLTIGNNFFVIN
jgi:hypothetical protein